jgi:hypothetical protein
MDPITPLTKQELENRGWQMTTVENPTPDPGPTVVQQMRLEFATTKAYKGSEGLSRTLRFKLFGVAEADLPNIRLEFGRFIKTRHTAASSLVDKGAAPNYNFTSAGHYMCKGFIVPNPIRGVAWFKDGSNNMGDAEGIPFDVPKELGGNLSTPESWRKPFQRGSVCLIGRTRLQASSVNPNEYVAVDPNPDANIEYTDGNPRGTILTLTDFIVPFVALYPGPLNERTFAAGHRCGTVTTNKIQEGGPTTEKIEPFVSLRFVKCGFRLVNVVTGETSPILEFVPIVTLLKPGTEWGVVASVSYGSYNPKRHFTAKSVGR